MLLLLRLHHLRYIGDGSKVDRSEVGQGASVGVIHNISWYTCVIKFGITLLLRLQMLLHLLTVHMLLNMLLLRLLLLHLYSLQMQLLLLLVLLDRALPSLCLRTVTSTNIRRMRSMTMVLLLLMLA